MKDDNKEKLPELEKKTGYAFKDTALLRQALTHSSFKYEKGGKDNERLEFVGDAVLGMLVSEHLLLTFPNFTEGELSKIKSVAVSKTTLAKKAKELEVGQFLLLGKGEESSRSRGKVSILADTFESLAGAIYLDGGLDACRDFCIKHLKEEIEKITLNNQGKDYKSLLQEYVQANINMIPEYRLNSAYGPEHKKHFVVEVAVDGKVAGSGEGVNKKEAEQRAARKALEKKYGLFPK